MTNAGCRRSRRPFSCLKCPESGVSDNLNDQTMTKFTIRAKRKDRKTAQISHFYGLVNGPSDRIRTCGILLPKQARYQLRYTRLFSFSSGWASSPNVARYQLRCASMGGAPTEISSEKYYTAKRRAVSRLMRRSLRRAGRDPQCQPHRPHSGRRQRGRRCPAARRPRGAAAEGADQRC